MYFRDDTVISKIQHALTNGLGPYRRLRYGLTHSRLDSTTCARAHISDCAYKPPIRARPVDRKKTYSIDSTYEDDLHKDKKGMREHIVLRGTPLSI